MRGKQMNEVQQIESSNSLGTVDRLDLAGLTLDLRREELRDAAGTRIELRNRSFGVLRHLATNAGRVVTKDELLEVNWPGVTVTIRLTESLALTKHGKTGLYQPGLVPMK